jgi:hypothetical protein
VAGNSNALRALNLLVEVHDDHFAPDETDVRWLSACGERGWVVVTKDLSIRSNPAEIAALKAARVHAIFLHGRKRPIEYAIANFSAGLGRILTSLEDASDPHYLVVMGAGRVKVLD